MKHWEDPNKYRENEKSGMANMSLLPTLVSEFKTISITPPPSHSFVNIYKLHSEIYRECWRYRNRYNAGGERVGLAVCTWCCHKLDCWRRNEQTWATVMGPRGCRGRQGAGSPAWWETPASVRAIKTINRPFRKIKWDKTGFLIYTVHEHNSRWSQKLNVKD